METTGQIFIHRVALTGMGSGMDQKTAWPPSWVSGEVGREVRKSTAPATVLMLVSNSTAGLSLRIQASSNPATPSVLVTAGTDGLPGWIHVEVGKPLVLVNDQTLTVDNDVTLFFQY